MPTNNNYTYGPAAVDTGAPAPAPIGPLDTSPAAVPSGPGLGLTPTATRAPVIPQVELPVQTQLTPEGANGPNVGGTNQQRYITILFDGTVVTNNATSLNFTGNGVSVSNLGTTGANIVITSGGGGNGNYSNSNVSAFLAAFGSNAVSTTGNVTAGYVFGNGSQLTGITANYSNSNVSAFLAAFGSNAVSTTGTVTAGNITGGNLTTAGIANVATLAVTGSVTVQGSIGVSSFLSAAGNVTGGNILTGGVISATGNITGNYILGNGSQLTGLAATYGNANVVANLAALGSNPVSTTGNVTGGNLLTSGIVSAGGTITGTYLYSSGAVSGAGNVVGGNVLTAGI